MDSNWSPVGVPSTPDKIIFTNANSSEDCDMNIAEVTEVDVQSTYAGTITLDNGFTISSDLHIDGGTFDTGANRALTVTGGVSGSGILVGNSSSLYLGWLTMDGTYDASDNATYLTSRSGPGAQLLMNASDITHNNGIFQFNGAAGGNSYINLYGASDATNGLYDVYINASGRTITNPSNHLTIQRHLTLTAGTFHSYPKNLTVVGTINLNGTSELHCSGNIVSANNWDKSSGPGTLHCWGDETVSSNDNMQLKGVYHEDCTATINCPAVMGNGGVQAVSGTATPTFIVGGWSASLRPPGNSKVILTGSRDVYVDSGGGSYEESGFWDLILSGGASTNKKMGGGQNTSFKVFNDFEIQADCVFATDGTTSITAPTPALDVRGTMNLYGTFSGNRNTYAPDQNFESVEIEATGVFDATSGTTFLGNSPLIQLSTADSTFTHNNGTVLLSDTAHGGWNLGGDGNFNGTNSFYNLSISGSVVNVSSNYLNVENDFTCIHNTANPASYGYQWRPYNGSTTIQGDLILKESGSGWPCSFGIYYIAGAGYTANTTIYGNVIMGSGTTLALTTSGSKTFELYGSFINNGGEVLVF